MKDIVIVVPILIIIFIMTAVGKCVYDQRYESCMSEGNTHTVCEGIARR
jgi:hypothetical protein